MYPIAPRATVESDSGLARAAWATRVVTRVLLRVDSPGHVIRIIRSPQSTEQGLARAKKPGRSFEVLPSFR